MKQEIYALRSEMETDATSINKPLRQAVKTMNWVILLRNCSPSYRLDYARRLRKLGQITLKEAMEFGVTS